MRVVLDEVTDAVLEATQRAGADSASRNGRQIFFTAAPERRLEIIRAIEGAGANIEEFHTETPDWEELLRKHFGTEERPS